MQNWGKHLRRILAISFLAIQLVPVHRENPPVDPAKTIFATATVPANIHAIVQRSCKDCHSNETRWPWYSKVAPVSWLVANDVKEARHELNFSEWGTYSEKRKDHKLEEICDQVRDGGMPDAKYTWIHRDAKLGQEERSAVCAWTESLRKPGTPEPAQPSAPASTH
jgi:hypothetical protein